MTRNNGIHLGNSASKVQEKLRGLRVLLVLAAALMALPASAARNVHTGVLYWCTDCNQVKGSSLGEVVLASMESSRPAPSGGQEWTTAIGTCWQVGIANYWQSQWSCSGTYSHPQEAPRPASGGAHAACAGVSYLPGGQSICGIIQNDSVAVNDENLGPCPDNCAGNPLNIGTGNKYQEEVDYSPPYEGSVRFVRFYNSLEGSEMWAGYGTSSVIGSNWGHYYMRSIRRVQDVDIYMLVTRWDARVLRFKLVGGAWVQKEDHPERLTELSGGAWELRNAENELEYYDATGKLTSIIDAKGRTTTLVYSEDAAAGADANFESNGRSMPPGTLVRVVDFKGRALTLKYVHGPVRLSRVIDPTGEVIQYAYSAQTSTLQKRLLSVT